MDAAELIQVDGACAYCRPVAEVTLDEAGSLVEQAIVLMRERGVPKLLMNILQLAGFPSPTLPQRYFLARKFAAAAQGKVQMSLVVQREMIDPEKFGVLVARNAGMNADVFDNEPEALAWLSPKPVD